MNINTSFWKNRRVLVTGHTGFMGGWLCERLMGLGARVSGFALAPSTAPALFEATGLATRMQSFIGNVCDLDHLEQVASAVRPQIVFHLAAQALVRRGHRDPVGTFATNVMGSVNIMEAVRRTGGVSALVMVTTDKVYENREWHWGYRETDGLGGFEPYGVSKACAELATNAYVHSYFGAEGPAVATVRAGNIIGGGDWNADRLVPDAVRAFKAGRVLEIRHPDAVRPWQHVLEPVEGMLLLADALDARGMDAAGAWNLGPSEDDARSVAWVADRMAQAWGKETGWAVVSGAGPYEAQLLTLSSAKAHAALGWSCRWNAARAVEKTAAWYRAFYEGADMTEFTRTQINDYVEGDSRGEFKRQVDQISKRAVA